MDRPRRLCRLTAQHEDVFVDRHLVRERKVTLLILGMEREGAGPIGRQGHTGLIVPVVQHQSPEDGLSRLDAVDLLDRSGTLDHRTNLGTAERAAGRQLIIGDDIDGFAGAVPDCACNIHYVCISCSLSVAHSIGCPIGEACRRQ